MRAIAPVLVATALVSIVAFPALAQLELAAGEGVSFWAADAYTKIDPAGKLLIIDERPGYRERNSAWDASAGAGGTVSLFAARNETVAFQILIEGGEAGLEEVTVTLSDLAGAADGEGIAAAGYTLFLEHYTEVKRPSQSPAYSMGTGLYPDALIPMSLPGWASFAVAAGATQAVWVDLHVPQGAAAGEYAGAVTVAAGGKGSRSARVKLVVWDLALPAESNLRWRVGYSEQLADVNSVPFDRNAGKTPQEFLDLELKFYRLCRAHRITPTTHYTSPIPEHSGSGEALAIDWASYDRRFGRYLDGTAFDDGLPVNFFSLPVNPQSYRGWPSSTRYRDNVNVASFRRAFELTVEHWKEKGWNLDNAFVYVADEPGRDRYGLIKEHCDVIKSVEPRVHRCVAFYKQFGVTGAAVVAEFRDYVNHWAIAGDYMLRGALDGLQERGDWVGIYQGSEPFQGGEALDGDGLSLVTWPWIAWLYRLDTLFIYNSTEWNTSDIWTDPDNHGWVTNSQGVLFYPGLRLGVKEALPSIRLKQMRRGMQDYEYMRLLAQLGGGATADAIARRVIVAALDEAAVPDDKHYGPGKWLRDPSDWLAARREMAEAIIAHRAGGQ